MIRCAWARWGSPIEVARYGRTVLARKVQQVPRRIRIRRLVGIPFVGFAVKGLCRCRRWERVAAIDGPILKAHRSIQAADLTIRREWRFAWFFRR